MLLFPLLALAASQVIEVNPNSLQQNLRQYKGPHFALTTEAKPNGLLLITLGGTNSQPKDMLDFAEEASKLGYQSIGIDYINGPPDGSISTGCRESKDPDCFDKFRREVVRGEAVSPLVKVGPHDSIESRIRTLLLHLGHKDPARWGKFLKEGEVDWSKVVIAGHSQGSGHAAFLAKAHEMKGVVLLAGPQDSFADGRTATWLRQPSRTPSDRFYSFLHKKDFFESDKQIAVARVLIGNEKAATAPATDCGGSHILLTERDDVGDAHMSVIEPFFREVWSHILREQVGP